MLKCPAAWKNLPRLVKVSGGRSSGMMFLKLLTAEPAELIPERGDVAIFCNTGAERPETLDFIFRLKKESETWFNFPFFVVEFRTYERPAKNKAETIRTNGYRLVGSRYTADNIGRAFEELLSWKQKVPNQYERFCTQYLKVETGDLFMQDYLTGKGATPAQGVRGEGKKMSIDAGWEAYKSGGGTKEKERWYRQKRYVYARKAFHPPQAYRRYSEPSLAWQKSAYGRETPEEWVDVVGFRADEPHRIAKSKARGDMRLFPLKDWGVRKQDVLNFWSEEGRWQMGPRLPKGGAWSNCAFCFLKTHAALKALRAEESLGDHGPCTLDWWREMENRYANHAKYYPGQKLGFFKLQKKGVQMSYDLIASDAAKGPAALDFDAPLPCECID